MYWWRITKYDPRNRNEMGHYMKNEWTEYSDIGKQFEGKQLTPTEYLRIENKYIQAIILCMNDAKVAALEVRGLEKQDHIIDKLSTPEMINIYGQIKKYQLILAETIPDLVRLILRSKLWCRLESSQLKIHFGWDYYMYIGCTKPMLKALNAIQESGLFVEEFISPHIPEDEEPEFH